MQDVYATTFALTSAGSAESFEEALERTARWLEPKLHAQLDFGPLGESQRAFEDTTLTWAHRRDPAGAREAFDAVLVHPADTDPNAHWRAAVVLSREGERCRATIRVSRGSTVHKLRPRPFTVAPPGLVADLLRRPLHGYAAALEVHATAENVRADRISSFVDANLRNAERALPTVVCDVSATAPLSADDLARRLVGLAHVVVLHDVEAWEALRDELPSDYVPYGGARLYWPGFGDPGERIRHPYFTRNELRARDLHRRISRLLRDLSVSLVPRDHLPDRLRREELRQRLAVASDADAVAEDQAATIARLERDVDDALRAWEREEERASQLHEANTRLAAELATAKDNVAALARYREDPGLDDEDEEDGESGPAAPEAFGEEFVEAIDGLASPALAFTERARGCGRSNNYPRPADMYDSLSQLEEIARAYHDGSGELGGDLVTVAKHRAGLRLAMHDNGYVDTTFDFDGRQLDRRPHVKLDDHVPPSEVGRIYFALDRDRKRFVVDWFGVKRDRP